MANEIRTKDVAEAAFTITINGLADGAGRWSTAVTNTNDQPAALVSVRIYTSADAPDVGSAYTVYLLRDLGTIAVDEWSGSDAAYTPGNAPILGTVVVTADATTYFSACFDTAPLGPLGPTFGIGIWNASGQTSNAANCTAFYNYYVPEVQ